jgi:hypothetical protein
MKANYSVIPAEAGIQANQEFPDPGFRRGDGLKDFLRTHQRKYELIFIEQSDEMVN